MVENLAPGSRKGWSPSSTDSVIRSMYRYSGYYNIRIMNHIHIPHKDETQITSKVIGIARNELHVILSLFRQSRV
jgi:hypothetical protein